MLPSQRVARGSWHKKAKWMLKKVLIKPPTTQVQMRDLCTELIERKHGIDSRSTSVVSTALKLFDDPNLVNALNNNQTFLNAKERIQTLSAHILPSSASTSSHHRHSTLPASPTHQIINSTFQQAMTCPSCGRDVHCSHEGSGTKELRCSPKVTELSSSAIPFEDEYDISTYKHENPLVEEDISNEKQYTKGSIGFVPSDLEEEGHFHEVTGTNFQQWFGPLVLASLAVVGLAVGVFNGEIMLSHRLQSLSGRALAAVTMLVQASNSLFSILRD